MIVIVLSSKISKENWPRKSIFSILTLSEKTIKFGLIKTCNLHSTRPTLIWIFCPLHLFASYYHHHHHWIIKLFSKKMLLVSVHFVFICFLKHSFFSFLFFKSSEAFYYFKTFLSVCIFLYFIVYLCLMTGKQIQITLLQSFWTAPKKLKLWIANLFLPITKGQFSENELIVFGSLYVILLLQ